MTTQTKSVRDEFSAGVKLKSMIIVNSKIKAPSAVIIPSKKE